MHHVGFGDWFAAGLVKNSKKLKYIKTASVIVFGKENKQLTLVDFFAYVLADVRKMDIYKFVDYLDDKYGIVLRKDKITWLIRESSLYYDSSMERIYADKEAYYEDL